MNDFTIWHESAWWLEVVFNVLIVLLPTLAGAAVLAAGGLRTITVVRDGWRKLRPLVDEPSDLIVRQIAERTGRDPQQVSAFITSNLDRIVELLPLGETVK